MGDGPHSFKQFKLVEVEDGKGLDELNSSLSPVLLMGKRSRVLRGLKHFVGPTFIIMVHSCPYAIAGFFISIPSFFQVLFWQQKFTWVVTSSRAP